MIICDKKDCTGCFVCMNVCAKQAISVQIDEYGKTVPCIDEQKCIECGACAKVCPVNHKTEFRMLHTAIAAWSKNQEDFLESSSGGVAAAFAREVIKKGGTVYGSAAMDREVKHIRIEQEEDIQLLRGSKYVQSYTGIIYQEVKKDLRAGKPVLFTGVPCQIAGLKNYLWTDYDNLITVDLICHGTPPFQYLREHIDSKVKGTWDSVSFRGKRDWFLNAYRNGEVCYSQKRECDTYFTAFLKGLTYRDNCYSCVYAQPKRCSDITIGDFWGIDRSTMKNPYNGRISLVLPNTEKGTQFWKMCADCFVWEERTVEEAMNPAQGNLLNPSVPHEDRKGFIEMYPQNGFERAINATNIGKNVSRDRIKNCIKKNRFARLLGKAKKVLK